MGNVAESHACYRLIFVAAGFIYISIGAEIYQKRRQLRSLVSHSQPTVMSMKTTEVHIVSETMDKLGDSPRSHLGEDDFPQGRGFAQYAANVSSVDHAQTKPVNTSAQMSSSDAAAWAYTKCAMLFFVALLITWVINHSQAPNPRYLG
ncbi:G-protein coupled receptor [Penicillium lagena]|uniref:G-protein coupled receptor n=1 Tax=Penicillium lagena TaxID=94218 RepID=UPI0025401DFA|nr:G-protein coupled receptor [Penicillium lagena]KAJ5620979.1 G-protein coupled receptor [Penicillium lagena]